MRSCCLTWMGLAALALAACGPEGPSSLEGFGDGTGDDDGDPTGDGDGEPTGDGDGDLPSECIVDAQLGTQPSVFFEGELTDDGDDVLNHCTEFAIGDQAISWIAPHSGPFQANLFADFFGGLTLLQGGCDGSFRDCNFGSPSPIDFEAIEGQEYTFVIDGETPGWFALELFPLDVMPGTCPAGQLFDVPVTVPGSTVGGGNDFATLCGGEEAPDREFLFFPPVSGTYRIDTLGSSYDTVLGVFAGECNPGAELGCNDDAFDALQSALDVQLSAGQVYTIVVDGFGASSGDFNLSIELLDEQPGFCAGAEPLPPGGPLEINWPADETSDDVFQGCSMASFEKRFTWSTPEDGEWIVSLFGEGLLGLAILEDCEAGGGTCTVGANGIDLQLFAVAGEQYVIVTEWEPNGGSIELQIESVGVVGCGDNLGNAVPTVLADTTFISGDNHDGSCTVNPAPERELHWTAPASGTYRFSLEGSGYDTLMYIRDGGCEGVELGCSDDTFTPLGLQLWSSLELDLQAGQTVSIFVDGYSGAGDFNLEITAI